MVRPMRRSEDLAEARKSSSGKTSGFINVGSSSATMAPTATTHNNSTNGLSNNRTSRLLHSRSSTDSPRSLDGRKPQVFSPLKPPRSIQSPSLDSGDESSLRLERGNYNHMLQDIVSIKTMLLQLKRVLQESGENGLTRTDTLNPFDNVMKNGLLYNLKDGNGTQDGSQSDAEELADLRRQVVFLQGQVDEKERTIQSLQTQLTRYQNSSGAIEKTSNGDSKETSNAATQTDKLRPVSTGPSAVQSLSQDNGSHIASWSDSWNVQHQHHHHQQQQASRLASPLGSRRSSYDHQQQQHHHQHHSHYNHHNTTSTATPTSTTASTHRSRPGRPPSSPQHQSHQQSSAIPRRPTTLIPTRAARAVSASGRSPNS